MSSATFIPLIDIPKQKEKKTSVDCSLVREIVGAAISPTTKTKLTSVEIVDGNI